VSGVLDSAIRRASLPAPPFTHLRRLTDAGGLYEHADGTVPRREQGYRLDDAARALVVVRRERDRTLDDLEEHYLSFVLAAQHVDGRFRNRRGADLRWSGPPSVEDGWGRALWALGTAADDDRAIAAFELGARWQSRSPRAMAYAALGAAEVLVTRPGHRPALELIGTAAEVIGRPAADPSWPWPEPRLTYANALLPEALLAAGVALDRHALVTDGLALLDWLLDGQTRHGRLSVVPVGGRGPREHGPGFDQRPIEAAGIADACARAHAVTGHDRWLDGIDLAAAWFLGVNDSGTSLHDPRSGGGCDALERTGRTEDQGAEATLALVSTLQRARSAGRGGPASRAAG
jgi:hypothetical protein